MMAKRRHWLQFRLRTLLAFVVVVCVPLAWLGSKVQEKHRERKAILAIEALNARVQYDWDDRAKAPPPGPAWLRRLLGDDFFATAVRITFRSPNDLTDAGLVHFRQLNKLRQLGLQGAYITDAAVDSLTHLKSLENLDLQETHVTSIGVARLHKVLPTCEIKRYFHSECDGIGYEKIKVDGSCRIFAPIHEAAKIGDVATIEEELDEGVPVDLRVASYATREAYGTTPLMWAAARGQVKAVRCLIEAGADVDAAAPGAGVTALMAASGALASLAGDHEACVQLLLDAGANPNLTDVQERTAAFYACGAGLLFPELPDNLVPPRLRLHRTRSEVRPGAGGLLVDRKATSPPDRVKKARHGDAARLKRLIDGGADLRVATNDGDDLLGSAARFADAARIRVLLAAGADINRIDRRGHTPLELAGAYGDGGMFKLLFEAGSPWEPSLLPWVACAYEDVDEKVQLLLEHGAIVDQRGSEGETALLLALQYAPAAALRLLKAGADPMVRRSSGDSALVIAAEHSSAAVLEVLLKHPFDVEERSVRYQHAPALYLAAESQIDSAAKVRLLLAAGAKRDARDDRGGTALLAACREGNMEAIVALADAGAEVNLTDPDEYADIEGMTPLLYVANRGGDDAFFCKQTGGDAARALIRHGARIDARDARGRSVHALAKAADHKEVLEVPTEK